MPSRKVRVRDHDRRKPHKEDKTHVQKYIRTLETVVPKGHEQDYLAARNKFERRSSRSKAQDLSIEAQETGLIDDEEHVERWTEHPNEYDVAGVDDTLYGPRLLDLELVKQLLRQKFTSFSRASKEIVKKAKSEAHAVKRSKRIPREEKPKKLARIRERAKKDLEKTAKKDRRELDETAAKVHKATLASKRWSTERRRRAKYVADTVGCSVIQADALIRRAHSKGWDYDTVDWDQIQGKDLQYDERLGKLEHMVGKTYTEGEFETVVQSEKERWDDLAEQRKKEIDHASEYQAYKPEEYEIPPEAFGFG